MKYMYSLLFLACLSVSAAAATPDTPGTEAIGQDQQPQVSIIGDNTLRIANASGQVVYIYNVAGFVVQSFRVEGLDRTFDLNLPKGCYIIKVGKTVRKVSIR